MNTIINHKKYSVEYVFNMVGNYHFTDKNGIIYLVDGKDVGEFIDEFPEYQTDNWLTNAIAYAKYYGNNTEDGIFWWKVK